MSKRKSKASPKPLIIAVVGGSGSGKTWLADRLLKALEPRAVRLCLDRFYKDRSHLSPGRRARLNFDNPRVIDWEAFTRAVKRLASGSPALAPNYDFTIHCRTTASVVQPQPVIILEGLWVMLRRSIRSLVGLSIFLDCPGRTRLSRRLARDTQSRGRTAESVRRQFRETVEPMHVRYVEPQKDWTTIVVSHTDADAAVQQILDIISR